MYRFQQPVDITLASDDALPDDKDAPPKAGQFPVFGLIPPLVAGKFGLPEFGIRLRKSGKRAIPVSMPETAMYEYRDMSSRHDNVGSSRQILPVQTETIAGLEQHASDEQLGLRVLATNARHHLASLRGGYNVHDVSSDGHALSR